MLKSPKSLAFACGVFAAIVAVLTAHLRDSPGIIQTGPMLMVFCGLEGAMVVLLVKTLRSGGGKIQFSLLSSIVCFLAFAILMALNMGAGQPRGVLTRLYGWPFFAARLESVFQNGSERKVFSDPNYGNIALDVLIALCIVTACVILCESFIRLKRQQTQT